MRQQTVELPVPQILKETVEDGRLHPHERMHQRNVEVPMHQIAPHERDQERIAAQRRDIPEPLVRRTVEVPTPRTLKETAEMDRECSPVVQEQNGADEAEDEGDEKTDSQDNVPVEGRKMKAELSNAERTFLTSLALSRFVVRHPPHQGSSWTNNRRLVEKFPWLRSRAHNLWFRTRVRIPRVRTQACVCVLRLLLVLNLTHVSSQCVRVSCFG